MISLVDGDLYQWDTGRVVVVEPENGYVVHEVHFTTKKMDFAYVVKTYVKDEAVCCAIPNIILQQRYDIICYEVRENDDGEESVSSTTFDVIKRNRPEDYIYTESEIYTYKNIENRLTTLETEFEDLKAAFDEVHEIAEDARTTSNSTTDLVETLSSSVVKSVNNTFPDENGNVVIEAENVDGLDELLTGKADTTHNHDSVYDTIGSADAALTEAKSYVENYAFITTNDIDEICGANIVAASEVIF